METSERDLIAAVQGGDSRARDALAARYGDELDHYIRLRIGTHLRGIVEVEDVVQDTFATAFESLADFRWQGDGSFARWLRRIAENRILTLAKKHRRDEVLFVGMEDRPHGDASPTVASERDERFVRLESALNGLSPDHREVIVLARLRGLRLAEVAKRMHRSPNAVAHLLSRALEKLKESFGETDSLSLPPRRLDQLEGEEPSHDA